MEMKRDEVLQAISTYKTVSNFVSVLQNFTKEKHDLKVADWDRKGIAEFAKYPWITAFAYQKPKHCTFLNSIRGYGCNNVDGGCPFVHECFFCGGPHGAFMTFMKGTGKEWKCKYWARLQQELKELRSSKNLLLEDLLLLISWLNDENPKSCTSKWQSPPLSALKNAWTNAKKEENHMAPLTLQPSNAWCKPLFKAVLQAAPAVAPASSMPLKQRVTGVVMQIEQGEEGHSFSSLFGEYLKGAKRVCLVDPWFSTEVQLANLEEFIDVIVNIGDAEAIEIRTNLHRDNITALKHLQSVHRIINLVMEASMHDRKIDCSNGWLIKSGRGLDIFETAPVWQRRHRKTRKVEIEYLRKEKK